MGATNRGGSNPPDENQVARLMRLLSIDRAEALQVIEDDKRIDRGEKLFELPEDMQAGAKKARKDKLWKVEATIPREVAIDLVRKLKVSDLPYNYVDINKYYLFNVYCATQAQSAKIKEILDTYDAKYFVSESKNL